CRPFSLPRLLLARMLSGYYKRDVSIAWVKLRAFRSARKFRWKPACLVLLCSALTVFPARAQTQTASFDEIARQANDAWNANRLDDAARLYRRAVVLRPSWSEGWGHLAASLYQMK